MGQLSSAIQVTDGLRYGAGRFSYATPLRKPVLVWHTIEGSLSYDVARRHASPPHLWYSPKRRELFQTANLMGPAFALRHPAGTAETNNRGPCFQVELEGFARDTRTWPDEYYENIAQDVVRPLEQFCRETYGDTLVGGPSTRGLVYADEQSPIGPLASFNSPVRMTPSQWMQAHGIVGHMHVPYNSHWDPGSFRVDTLLRYVTDLDRPRELRLLTGGSRLLRGTDVRDWQEMLVRHGLLRPDEVDGFFGPRTDAATRHLQGAIGRSPDGIVTVDLASEVSTLPPGPIAVAPAGRPLPFVPVVTTVTPIPAADADIDLTEPSESPAEGVAVGQPLASTATVTTVAAAQTPLTSTPVASDAAPVVDVRAPAMPPQVSASKVEAVPASTSTGPSLPRSPLSTESEPRLRATPPSIQSQPSARPISEPQSSPSRPSMEPRLSAAPPEPASAPSFSNRLIAWFRNLLGRRG